MENANWKVGPRSKYAHLLITLFLIFLTAPFLEDIDKKFPFASALFFIAIVLTLRALELKKKIFWACVLTGALALVIEVCLDFFAGIRFYHNLQIVSMGIYAVFMFFSIVSIFTEMFKRVQVTGDTILGGMCLYLLMGFFWMIFYLMIYQVDKNAFNLTAHSSHGFFVYYSFATMTTLGYGDIYPVNRLAMILSTMQATVGQLYLTIFIARLVGLHVVHQVSRK